MHYYLRLPSLIYIKYSIKKKIAFLQEILVIASSQKPKLDQSY